MINNRLKWKTKQVSPHQELSIQPTTMNLAQPAMEAPKPSMTKVAVFNMEKKGVSHAQMNTTMKSPDDAYPTFD